MSRRTLTGSAATSLPRTRSSPLVGRSRVATVRTNVVLPAPFGPRMARTSPGGAIRSRLSRAVTLPNRTVTPRSSPRESYRSGSGRMPSRGGCWGDDGRGADTVAAVFFGLVERVVGAAHHGLDGGAVVGVAGDPEACGGVPVEAQDVGVGDRGGHLFREDARAVEVGGGEHYDELVAAKSGDEVAGAHRLRQGGCDHREQLIAA